MTSSARSSRMAASICRGHQSLQAHSATGADRCCSPSHRLSPKPDCLLELLVGPLELSQGIPAAGHAPSFGGAARRAGCDFQLCFDVLRGHHWFRSQSLNRAKLASLSKWRCDFSLFLNFPGLFLSYSYVRVSRNASYLPRHLGLDPYCFCIGFCFCEPVRKLLCFILILGVQKL